MYGLPKDFDGRFLISRTVLEVGFAVSHVAIYFDGDNYIASEGCFSFYPAGSEQEKPLYNIEARITESDLTRLLGCHVTAVSWQEDGTLSMKFNNGYVLECYDDPHYESYFIKHGEKTISV